MVLSILYVGSRRTPPGLDGDATLGRESSVTAVSSTREALDVLESSPVDCVVAEQTPDGDCGEETLEAVRSRWPSLPIVLCSREPDVELVNSALRHDASAYHVRGGDVSLGDRIARVLDSTVSAGSGKATRDTAEGSAVTHGTPFLRVAETLNAAVVTIDTDSTIHFANDALAELTGYDHDGLVGHSFTKVMPERFREAHYAAVERYAETGDRNLDWDYVELAVHHSDGHEIPVAVSFSEFQRDGELFFTGVLRDISERKEHTRTLSALYERIQRLFRASTPEEVAEQTVAATSGILGYEFNTVRLYDPDEDVLRPVAVSEESFATMGERPVYDADTWGQGEAFRSDSAVVYDDISVFDPEGATEGPNPEASAEVESAMFVPIGDRGVLSVGAAQADAFDETTRSVAELLASNAEAALERVEREQELVTYETVLESIQDMVYVLQPDGTFSLVTDPLAEWLGYDRSRMADIDPSDVVDTDDLPEFQTKIEDLWETDAESATVETELTAADGTVHPVEVEVSLYPTDGSFEGTIGVVRDRSELEATRRELATERDRFTYLFNTMPDAVVEVVFEDGVPVVEQTNDAFRELFGYEDGQAVGRSINDLLLPDERHSEGRAIDARIADNEEWSGEVRRRTADGLRYFLFRGVPYRGPDDELRGFGIYTDITERKHRERRLKVLSRVLRHNLRNDLTVILGHAEALEQDVDGAGLQDTAAELRRKAQEVSRLSERARRIQKTLDRQGGATRDIAFEPYVQTLASELIPEDSEASVEVDVPTSLSVEIDERVELALANLVENARQYAGEAPRIRIAARTDDDALLLRVGDDGPGIPDIEWNVVSGREEVTQLSHGSGLGLWAVKWVAESYGGTMTRDGSDLGGDAVVLRLPGVA